MFAISARSLPTIRTYEAAVQFWEKAVVQDGLYRALNTKRDTAKRVWSPDNGKTIKFRLRYTDLVVYYSSEMIEITLWNSVSSAIFVNELTPCGICMQSFSGVMRVNRMLARHSGIRFNKVNDEWRPVLEDVQGEYKTLVDKKIAAQAVRLLKPFKQYREARRAIEGGVRFDNSQKIYLDPQEFESTEAWPRLYEQLNRHSFESVTRSVVAALGGLKEDPVPPGTIPPKSVYDPYV